MKTKIKSYTVKHIQTASYNLESTRCRNCRKSSMDGTIKYYQYQYVVHCEYCGFSDSGLSIKKQLKEQGIIDMRKKTLVLINRLCGIDENEN